MIEGEMSDVIASMIVGTVDSQVPQPLVLARRSMTEAALVAVPRGGSRRVPRAREGMPPEPEKTKFCVWIRD